MSRTSCPKQFLDIAGTGKTFLRYTFERFAKIIPEENILVVTTARYVDLVKEQLPELLPQNLLAEPYGRDTAPCIAYATYTLLKRNPKATMTVSPADHLIMDEDKFRKTMLDALEYGMADVDEGVRAYLEPALFYAMNVELRAARGKRFDHSPEIRRYMGIEQY